MHIIIIVYYKYNDLQILLCPLQLLYQIVIIFAI